MLSIPIGKEVKRIGIKGEVITKTIFYKLKFVVSARLMASSLSNLNNNLTQSIHNIKCKY